MIIPKLVSKLTAELRKKEERIMKDVYFTLTGTGHYYGKDFIKKGMKVKLIKEPDNEFDKEAIRVELKGMGKIGYVGNNPYTVIGDSMSAGRMYHLMKKKAKGKVVLVTEKGILCKLKVD
jgi:hypothetical protein